jgi:hypothetical protein
MSINDEVTTRITDADTIATAAISAANDSADLFSDIGGVTPSVFAVSTPLTTNPFAPTLTDQPVAPTDARVAAAMAALDGVDTQAQDLAAQAAAADTYFVAFDAVYADVQTALAALRDQQRGIVQPQASDFGFSEPGLDTDTDIARINSSLRAIIESEIARDGQGYSDATETAMFEIDIERRELARQEEVDEALEATAGRGFTMPQGFHFEAVHRVNEKYRLAEEKKSEDVMILQSKLAQENKWIAINNGITYNQIQLAFYDAKAQRGLEAAAAVFGLTLSALRSRANILRQELAAVRALNTADIERARALLERYSLYIQKYRKAVQALTAKARGYTQKYESRARLYGAQVGQAVENSRIHQADAKIQLEMDKNTSEGWLAASQLSLRSFLMAARTRLGVASDRAKLQQTIASTTISSLGAVIQRTDAGETTISE